MFRFALPSISAIVLALSLLTPAATPSSDSVWQPTIDPADFVATIDNQYFPLTPGTIYTYEGTSDGETQTSTFEVTTETREVMGVLCTVVRDTVSVDGEVAEDTYDWFAQDNEGNVWYFGEASSDYEDGVLTSTDGSWEAGIDGAYPGIVMPADPQVGAVYFQEFYVGVAEDKAEILEVGATLDLPYGSFEDVLVTKEWNPLSPEVIEHKYYAPGVGLIMEEAVQGEDERMELVSISTQ